MALLQKNEIAMVSIDNLNNIDYFIDEYGVAYSQDGGIVYGAVDGIFVAEEYQIRDGVRLIEANSFHCCNTIKVLYMPDSVIEDNGSYCEGCKNLEKANVSKNLKHPNIAMFCGCESLREVYLPEGIETIGENMFCGCMSLERIKLPSTIKWFENDTFCSAPLRTIDLPESLEQIGDDTFICCRNLEKLVIPKKVERIGPWFVQAHDHFQGVECLSSHFRIEDEALITNYDDSLIACWSRKPHYVIPESVKHILSLCNDLIEEVEITNPSVDIGYDAFCSCTNLKVVYKQDVSLNLQK